MNKYFEKIFETDVLTKYERVMRSLNHQPLDRVPLHDQLSYNSDVISLYTGRDCSNFNFTREDVGSVIRKTMDLAFPPFSPRGTSTYTTEDGLVMKWDNWTAWHISRPFSDVEGVKDWLIAKTKRLREKKLDKGLERKKYREYMQNTQKTVGDTVILNYTNTGFCEVFDSMGLELFTYFYFDYPEVMSEYMEVSGKWNVDYVNAVADPELSPVILIAEDFSTKQGPIFGPEFLNKEHFPYIRALTEAWHNNGVKVIYHSDGNYKKAIPDLIKCDVDGFYCLEPNCGMDIVELKNTWPEMVWMGGVDGVDLMEQGTPEQVRLEIKRHITETNALQTGGMFIATSSEINPPIKPENFKAMVEASGEFRNRDFKL